MRKECIIDGCSRPDAGRRGLCSMHYHRWWRHGDVYKTLEPTRGMTDKQKIEHHSVPVPESGCWLWTGSLRRGGMGYGQLRSELAHRVAYLAFLGEIPENLCVLHKCDVPSCVNPAHLFLGTRLENMQDCFRKGRYAHQKIRD